MAKLISFIKDNKHTIIINLISLFILLVLLELLRDEKSFLHNLIIQK
ncbi:MAG: hypothetical protein QG614_189 [Patescibacteria group bacterium]|nr:hypothetical protein [Patescibacteria group bacterium]